MSVLIGGAEEEMGEPSNPAGGDRITQLEVQMVQMHEENIRLQEELTNSKKKGKQPDRGQLPRPGLSHDEFSVPRPPSYSRPPGYRPMGTWDVANPPLATGIKPILVKAQRMFKGDHNDIKCFLRDCTTYFEIFRQYYQNVPSLMIPLTHLKSVHACNFVKCINTYLLHNLGIKAM